MLRLSTAIFAVLLFIAPPSFGQEEVVLEPLKDNTLFEHASGDLSNGVGDHIFAGKIRTGEIRRAVLAFDLEGALPDGATVTAATLRLHVSNAPPGSGTQTFSLHRLTADWGEGESDAVGAEGGGTAAQTGDATWIHRFNDTDVWTNPGGDFEATPSATFDADGIGNYEASSEGLASDVRGWIDDPSSSFGWILIGNESANSTARRFDSRENGTAGNRPQLTITYTTGVATEGLDVPTRLRLAGNYPNPFATSTTIRYEVDRAQTVSLKLYDVLGREVRELVREYQAAGPNEVAVSADGLPAGTYLYCFDGGRCGRMALLP